MYDNWRKNDLNAIEKYRRERYKQQKEPLR